jgi:probable F420-dependent oxidoreductase
MADFGIATGCTHYTIQPAELGRWAEAHGFESLWFAEHTHIPVSSKPPGITQGGEMPQYYKEPFDPFVGLAAAAVVTTKIKLGTSICLVTEHHPINLAKTIATLDRVSNGRFLFGIGGGWNAEEMANHAVELKNRFQVTRERILAMKEIWTKEIAEYHGKFVDFDPMWCWPKPEQSGGPPVLMGAWSKWAPKRIAEYCDGWLPIDAAYAGGGACPDLAGAMEAIRSELLRSGRSIDGFDFSVVTAEELAPPSVGLEARIRELLKLGFNRVVFLVFPAAINKQRPLLDRYATLIRNFA